jgi:hypothetical protein
MLTPGGGPADGGGGASGVGGRAAAVAALCASLGRRLISLHCSADTGADEVDRCSAVSGTESQSVMSVT